MGKRSVPVVLFNASVILAGLKSPSGGSGKILSWSRENKITGIVSEIIVDEAVRNVPKIGLNSEEVIQNIQSSFTSIYPPPNKAAVERFKQIIINEGDAHVLAACEENKANFLVTLDKKHLLILKGKIKKFKIVSPKELIESLSF